MTEIMSKLKLKMFHEQKTLLESLPVYELEKLQKSLRFEVDMLKSSKKAFVATERFLSMCVAELLNRQLTDKINGNGGMFLGCGKETSFPTEKERSEWFFEQLTGNGRVMSFSEWRSMKG